MSAGPTTSTTYPPGDWATSAVTGTASTGPGLLSVVMVTVTGAWSKVPAADGCVSVTVTGIVADMGDPDATVPTEEIVPGVLTPSGSVTATASPTATADSCEVLTGIITMCRSDVAASTSPEAGPPGIPTTRLTRSASGSNTTCPQDRLPDGLETPRCSSICRTADAVSHE